MESPEGSPSQPKIASFAPELIDEILGHLVADLEEYPATCPGPKAIGECALISRNWRGPVQRRLMRRLVIKSGAQAERVAEDVVATGLHVYVRTLVFECTLRLVMRSHTPPTEPTDQQIKSADGVSQKHCITLLPLFPNVKTLHLTPTFTQFRPSDLVVLQSCTALSHLSELWVETQHWQRDVELHHDLISLTPNLSVLSLTSMEDYTPLKSSMRSPIALPRLKTLSVYGGSFASSLTGLALLTPSTLAQITDLTWDNYDTEDASPLSLLQLMGPTLQTLHYTTRESDRDIVPELQQCIALEDLTLDLMNTCVEYVLPHLPSTTHTVTVMDVVTAHQLVADLTAPHATLETLVIERSFEYDTYRSSWETYRKMERDQLREVVQACKLGTLELVADNENVRKAIAEMD
ncbi:hypothetical protein RQP46_006211 [Phenoliferia psychrophenolica]